MSARDKADRVVDESPAIRLKRVYLALCRDDEPPSDADRAFLLDLGKRALPDDLAEMLLRTFKVIGDPSAEPLVEPFLHRTDAPILVDVALQALWWMGLTAKYKPFILQAVEPGFAWDAPSADIHVTALYAAGSYLREHHDKEFARMIAEFAGRDYHAADTEEESSRIGAAQTAAGLAMGADPEALAYDDELEEKCCARFLAERKDG
jgi:hypothetical protein